MDVAPWCYISKWMDGWIGYIQVGWSIGHLRDQNADNDCDLSWHYSGGMQAALGSLSVESQYHVYNYPPV